MNKKNFLRIAIVVTLTSLATADNMDRFCTGRPNGVFVANPRSCQHWIFCQNQAAHREGACEGSFYFDETIQMCRYPDFVNCKFDSVDVNCKTNELELHPHPDNCEQFVVCTNGFPRVQNCAPGLNWDYTRNLCDVPQNTPCYVEEPEVELIYTCHPGTTYVTFHPHDCQKFIVCSSGKRILNRCAPTLLFDPTKLRCDFANNVQCKLPEATIDYVCDPANPFYLAPHPHSCEYFIMCIGGNRQIERCAEGLHFDSVARQCNVIGNAVCKVSQ